MPSTLFCELERPGALEDQRALQLAFELSMLGLSEPSDTIAPMTLGTFAASILDDPRGKKSQNMTECVPVPSSEHVAEIVGRQGCKIKALRAKTNTYIKTPVRGEEPVFVVTGRKEDVTKAKREILSAAEHFSQIRASRKHQMGLGGASSSSGTSTPPGPPTNIPGHITAKVRVPYRVVGLVVGPKGATIKRIQHQTHTYIVTPSRDKEPIFEVTGLPESVEIARREIEAHIAIRTGHTATQLNGMNGLGPLFGDSSLTESPELMSVYNSGLGSLLSCLDTNTKAMDYNSVNNSTVTVTNGPFGSNGLLTSFTSSGSSSRTSSLSGRVNNVAPGTGKINELMSIWSTTPAGDTDEGLGDSPSFDSSPTSSSIWTFPNIPLRPSPTASASPTDSLLGGSLTKRECLVCAEREVQAALVPCGHNLFCMDCAQRVRDSSESQCPVCSQTVKQAIRIIS